MRPFFLTLIFATVAVAQDGSQLPSTADVVAKMIEHDNQRQAGFRGYAAARRYVLESRNKRAEMLVQVECLDNGSKQFQTVSASGWGAARKHVFPKLLDGERESSMPGARDRSRVIPDNYTFELIGTETINQRPAYVLAITPRTQNKYLVKGKIWVDVEEYAIARIEGMPAKNPSFWIKSVHFVHTYQKTGALWLPVSVHSVTDVRIIGSTKLTIDYFEYGPKATALAAFRGATPGSLQ